MLFQGRGTGAQTQESIILLRILARPACDRPRGSNGDRVAHQNGQFSRDPLGTTAKERVTGGGLTSPQPSPHSTRANRRKSIYLSTRVGNLPRGCTMPQVDSGHEPLKRFVPCCRDNRAELSSTSTVQIISWVSKPTINPLRDARWNFQSRERTKRSGSQFTSTFNAHADKHVFTTIMQ